MAMNVSFHATNRKDFFARGYVTESQYNPEKYAVVKIEMGDVHERQEITIFANLAQLQKMQDAITDAIKGFDWTC